MSTPHPIIEQAKLLDSQWQIMLAMLHQSLTQKVLAEKTLVKVFGDRGRYCFSGWNVETGKLSKTFESMADILIESLCKNLRAKTGCAPTIDYAYDQDHAYGEEPSYTDVVKDDDRQIESYHLAIVEYARTRSLEAYAASLIEAYSVEKATTLALGEASACVNEYFQPPRWKPANPQPVLAKTVKDRLVLETDTYWNSYDSWRMNSGCRNRLYKLGNAVATLLGAAGKGDSIEISREFRALVNQGHYSSRERIDCGPGLFLVLFKDKIQFHFLPDVLEALQIAAIEHRLENAA
jgi:hypothetical protein